MTYSIDEASEALKGKKLKYGRRKLVPGDGSPRHGTNSGYVNGRCRCELCAPVGRKYRRDHYVPKRREILE